MKILDFFNKTVRKERKNYSFAKKVITTEFMKTFSDMELRNRIYNYLSNFEEKDYEKIVKNLMKLNQKSQILVSDIVTNNYIINDTLINDDELLNYFILNNCVINEHNIKIFNLFRNEILNLNISINYLSCYKDKFIKMREKNPQQYEIILKNNTLRELAISDQIEQISLFNQDFLLNHPNEIAEICQMSSSKQLLIDLANNCDFDKYYILKDKIKKISNYTHSMEYNEIIKASGYNENLIDEILSFDCGGAMSWYQNCYYRNFVYYSLIKELKSEKKDLNKIRNLICVNYTGVDPSELCTQVNIIKNANVDLPDSLNNIIAFVNSINEIEDFDEIVKMLENFNPMVDSKEFQNQLASLKINEKMYNNILYKPLDDKSSRKKINYNGKEITCIETDCVDFNMLVHRIVADRWKDSKNGREYTENIFNNPNLFSDNTFGGTDYLSTSLIFDSNMVTFSTGNIHDDVVLGFSDITNNAINSVSFGDGRTSMEGIGKEQTTKFLSKQITPEQLHENILPKSEHSYNEITISRRENGQKKKPDYVVVFKNVSKYLPYLNENSMKFASCYDIPIVEVDGQKLFNNAYSKLLNKLNDFKATGIMSIVEFKEILSYLKVFEHTYYYPELPREEIINYLVSCDSTLKQVEQSIMLLEYYCSIEKDTILLQFCENKLKELSLKKREMDINNLDNIQEVQERKL